MIVIVDELRETVIELRSAVIDRDITRIQANTQSINDIVQRLSEYSPDVLTDKDRRFVKELIWMTTDINQLLTLQLDYTKLTIENIRRQKQVAQIWYA